MVLFRPIISFNYKMSKNPFGRSVDTTRLVFHLLLLVLLLLFLLYIFEKTKKWKKKKQTSSIVGRWTPLSVHFIYKHISTASRYVSFFFFYVDIVCVRRRFHAMHPGQSWSTNEHKYIYYVVYGLVYTETAAKSQITVHSRESPVRRYVIQRRKRKKQHEKKIELKRTGNREGG